jgi:hypothetical protein
MDRSVESEGEGEDRKNETHLPVFADREALAETPILVSFGEEPRGVHEIFALEIFCDLFVPQSDVCFVVIDNRAQFFVGGEVFHQNIHSCDAFVEVDNELFGRLRRE